MTRGQHPYIRFLRTNCYDLFKAAQDQCYYISFLKSHPATFEYLIGLYNTYIV